MFKGKTLNSHDSSWCSPLKNAIVMVQPFDKQHGPGQYDMALDEHLTCHTAVSLSESRHDASLYVLVKEHAEHAYLCFSEFGLKHDKHCRMGPPR